MSDLETAFREHFAKNAKPNSPAPTANGELGKAIADHYRAADGKPAEAEDPC